MGSYRGHQWRLIQKTVISSIEQALVIRVDVLELLLLSDLAVHCWTSTTSTASATTSSLAWSHWLLLLRCIRVIVNSLQQLLWAALSYI